MSNITTTIPIIDLNLQHRDVLFNNTPESITIRPWISTSYSGSSSNFSMPPPSQTTFIDRMMYISQPVVITYAGTTTGSALLQSGYDALRSYPMSSIIASAQLTINSVVSSIQMSEIIPYINRYKKQQKVGHLGYFDRYQNYVDGVGANNNPLGVFQDGVDLFGPRGGYPMIIVNGATASTITATIYEPLYISPLTDDYEKQLGLTNIRTMELNLNYISNLSRIVSHATSLATLSSVTVALGQPSIYQRYVTPPIGYVPRTIEYGHQQINRFVTASNSALTSNSSTIFTSSNIQLNAIPSHMYLFVREATSNLTYASSDVFTNISNVNINFNNRSGLLSTVDEYSLYLMAKSNGLKNTTFSDWHGTIANLATQIGTSGSILRLDFGKDITLGTGEYPGKVGAFNMQINMTVKNVNQTTQITTPSFYIITVTPAKFVIGVDGSTYERLGVEPIEGQYVPYGSISKYYGGSFSDFISSVGNFVNDKIMNPVYDNVIKPVYDHVINPAHQFVKDNQLISKATAFIPASYGGPVISGVAKSLGYGLPGGMSSGGSGGRMTSRAELLSAIKRL